MNKTIDADQILYRVTGQSRRRLAQEAGTYYEFTEKELTDFAVSIIKECASIADANDEHYRLVAQALSNLVLPLTGDLIRHHFGLEK